jgi:hypothetical protein
MSSSAFQIGPTYGSSDEPCGWQNPMCGCQRLRLCLPNRTSWVLLMRTRPPYCRKLSMHRSVGCSGAGGQSGCATGASRCEGRRASGQRGKHSAAGTCRRGASTAQRSRGQAGAKGTLTCKGGAAPGGRQAGERQRQRQRWSTCRR